MSPEDNLTCGTHRDAAMLARYAAVARWLFWLLLVAFALLVNASALALLHWFAA